MEGIGRPGESFPLDWTPQSAMRAKADVATGLTNNTNEAPACGHQTVPMGTTLRLPGAIRDHSYPYASQYKLCHVTICTGC